MKMTLKKRLGLIGAGLLISGSGVGLGVSGANSTEAIKQNDPEVRRACEIESEAWELTEGLDRQEAFLTPDPEGLEEEYCVLVDKPNVEEGLRQIDRNGYRMAGSGSLTTLGVVATGLGFIPYRRRRQ